MTIRLRAAADGTLFGEGESEEAAIQNAVGNSYHADEETGSVDVLSTEEWLREQIVINDQDPNHYYGLQFVDSDYE